MSYNSVDAVEQTIHNHLRQLMLASTKFATVTELMLSVCSCPFRRYYDNYSRSYKMSTIKDEMYVYSVADCLNELLCGNVGNVRTLVPASSWLILPSDYACIEDDAPREPYDDSDYTSDPFSNVQVMEDITLTSDANDSSSGSSSVTAFATSERIHINGFDDSIEWVYVEDDEPIDDVHVYDNFTVFGEDDVYTESVAPYITDWANEQLTPIGDSSSSSDPPSRPTLTLSEHPSLTLNIPTERTSGCTITRLADNERDELMNMIHMC